MGSRTRVKGWWGSRGWWWSGVVGSRGGGSLGVVGVKGGGGDLGMGGSRMVGV